MRNFQSNRFLFLATEEASPTRLAQRHSRRLSSIPLSVTHPPSCVPSLPPHYGTSSLLWTL